MKFIDVNVIGVQQLDYTNNQGNRIQGTMVYFAHEDPSVIGGRTGSVFVPTSAGKHVEPKQVFQIVWDRYNRQRPYSIIEN